LRRAKGHAFLDWPFDTAVCDGTMTLAELTRSVAGARPSAPAAKNAIRMRGLVS
jgi:hypothetical protein